MQKAIYRKRYNLEIYLFEEEKKNITSHHRHKMTK